MSRACQGVRTRLCMGLTIDCVVCCCSGGKATSCHAGAYHNARLALKSRQHASLQVHQKRQGPPVLAARPHTVGVLRPTGAGYRDDETLAGRTSPAER